VVFLNNNNYIVCPLRISDTTVISMMSETPDNQY